MAAKWGSWDDSLVFLKRTLGPSAVLAPLFAWWWLCLRLYMCDSHFCMPFVSGLQYLGTGCWKQGIFSLSEASLPITGHSCLPGMSAFLFLFLAFSWEREGSWSGLRWAAAGSWPLPPLHGLLRAGWMACYFTEFPNILAGNILCRSSNWLKVMTCSRVRSCWGVSKPLLPLFSSSNRLRIASSYCFVSVVFSNYFLTCSSNLKDKGHGSLPNVD